MGNPWWRAGVHWRGELSPGWLGWANFPELAHQLSIGDKKTDGVFHMRWRTFCEHFSDVGVIPTDNVVPKMGKYEAFAPALAPGATHARRPIAIAKAPARKTSVATNDGETELSVPRVFVPSEPG